MATLSGILSTQRVNKINFKRQDKRYPKEQKKKDREGRSEKERELMDKNESENNHIIDISI